MRWQGVIFRCHKPRYANSPLSTKGANINGGRFNRPGTEALYTSRDALTALAEVKDGRHTFPPKTIVAYHVDINNLVSLVTDEQIRTSGFEREDLSCEWELLMDLGGRVPSWEVQDHFRNQGYTGMMVPSFAADAPPGGINLVLWEFSGVLPQFIHTHDPHHDLPKNDDSWV